MLRLVAFIFLLIYSEASFAIKIDGNALSYVNQTIKWVKKSDYLSNQYTIIDKCKIDSNGNFNLEGEVPNSCLTELSIGMSSGFLYADKNTEKYTILFPKDTTTSQSTLKKHYIQLIFEDLPITELNSLLLDFNLQLDYFLFGDTSKLIRMAKHETEFQDSLNAFKIKISNRYKNYRIKYLHNYVRYEVALMEQMAHQNKGEKYRYYLYKTYLSEHPINYDNDAYMEFFNQFYDQPFRLVNQDIIEKVDFSINNLNSLKELSVALENSIYFQEKELAELAIIKGLGNAFFSYSYNRNNVLSILQEIAKESQWETHQKIAKNMIITIEKLLPNTYAPLFTLNNQNDSIFNLKSYRGKYTYINFFATWSSESIHDMEIINQLKEKYSFVNFISINLNKEKTTFNDYILNNQYDWNICYFNNQTEILTDYSVDHLPSYVLINPDGTICQFPAYPPSPLSKGYSSTTIDETFFNIEKKNKAPEPFRIGGKN